ncbi:MAG: molecular chaperone HscB [Planctomycetota bacterium]|jgi:molecular chaperone HscB
MTTICTGCESALRSRLVCEDCGTLQTNAESPTPFESFGMAASQQVDLAALKKRLLKLSRAMHPDFFGNADEDTQQLAIDNTAELNAAFELLKNDLSRADWLVRSLGGPDENAERQMPQAFLIEVMEWNELLEEAQEAPADAPKRHEAAELGKTLQAERANILQGIDQQLTPLPEQGAGLLTEVRKQMNAVRYVDRALTQIKELAIQANH